MREEKMKIKAVRLKEYLVKQIDSHYGGFSAFVNEKIRKDKNIKKKKGDK
ncbi:MAG: hypothetical protein KAX49_20660 [Halanaerobiales bacterium]|nr:hypothetical protein [Halanaerobiales bacterium]